MIRLPRPANAPCPRLGFDILRHPTCAIHGFAVGNSVIYFLFRVTKHDNKRLAYTDVGAYVQSGTMNMYSHPFSLTNKMTTNFNGIGINEKWY